MAGNLLVELGGVGSTVAAPAHAPDDNRQLDTRWNGAGQIDGLSSESRVGRVSLGAQLSESSRFDDRLGNWTYSRIRPTTTSLSNVHC